MDLKGVLACVVGGTNRGPVRESLDVKSYNLIAA
jgi:hypothetical protein